MRKMTSKEVEAITTYRIHKGGAQLGNQWIITCECASGLVGHLGVCRLGNPARFATASFAAGFLNTFLRGKGSEDYEWTVTYG